MSLVEKQRKLYRFFQQADDFDLDEPLKVAIKKEKEDSVDLDDDVNDIFIDCTPSIFVSGDLKLETSGHLVEKRKSAKRKKSVEINNEEHQRLLEEFRVVLKHRKDKK